MDNVEKHSGTTNIEIYTFSYKWIINNFNICDPESLKHLKVNDRISSPSFYASKYPDFGWHLSMHYTDDTENSEGHISLFLHFRPATERWTTVKASFKICIINRQMEHKFEKEETQKFYNGIGHGFPKFISKSNLLNPAQGLLLDNQLTVLCTITIVKQVKLPKDSLDIFYENKDTFLLSDELQSLFKNKQLSDVTLVASGKHLGAHKAVLAARSSVFLAMLQNDMIEKNSAKIELTDVNFDVLTEIVQYMYTDDIKNIKQYFKEFLLFADKYDIKGLKFICEKYIYNELSINNAVEILILAETYNCDILKSQVLKFILKNAKRIVETSQFQTMKKDLPSMVADIITAQTNL